MRDWTEQEEQEMIELAKTGDPRANYELSLWALARGEEEPDEPRWNRLAAKCLVKAAQAGYGPAQERMEGILQQQQKDPTPSARPSRSRDAAPAEPVRISDARQSARASRQAPAARQTPARRPAPASRRPARAAYDEDDYDDEYEDEEDYDDEYDDRPVRAPKARGGGQSPFSQWGDAQWRKMEMICIGICAVLLIAIAAIFISSKAPKTDGNDGSSVPQAGQANPAESEGDTEPEATPEAEAYPTDEILSAIRGSGLEVLPGEQEYVSAPTTATVSVGSTTLRLRIGPSTTYSQVKDSAGADVSMPDGAKVEVYAKKGDWWLLKYDGNLGWSSSGYLIEDAEAASVG